MIKVSIKNLARVSDSKRIATDYRVVRNNATTLYK